MELILITVLFLFDCSLLWILLKNKAQVSPNLEMLQSITEERQMIMELCEDLKGEMANFRSEMGQNAEHMQHLATEIDVAIQSSKALLIKESETAATQIKELIGKPLEDLSKKYVATKKLLARLEKERDVISRIVQKGDRICQFLDQKIPYDELISELEDKKYTDTRALLALGKSPKEIANALGLTEGEVKLVAGLSY